MEDSTPNTYNDKAETSDKPPPAESFKKPILIGKLGKLPKKPKDKNEKPKEEPAVESSLPLGTKTEVKSDPKSHLPPAVLLKELSVPIPYKEPKWSGVPPDGTEYALEVLKSGMIVEKIELTKKPYYVFGRLANCDVVMAHPTISRHHAVLQYKAFAEEGESPSGWYLYDLGSTHGTFLNRDKIKIGHFTRVRVGHMIKLGCSSRSYILMGPDFDSEEESELTVSEIKQKAAEMKKERERQIQEVIEQRKKEKEEAERKREEQGIDWGMGDDAEEEEVDLSENPFASTTNEELYLDDPKKTLRGYYEREGLELTYDCQERGIGQFVCKVELPLDDAQGRPLHAEVIHKGKKKEAVIQCALEACRILDRHGLLRQAKHESRSRKKRDWSADDYYDSDEDTFLDRTGAVEHKRERRMRMHDNREPEPVTYDDLVKQCNELEEKIKSEERKLEKLRAASKADEHSDTSVDALDLFMSNLAKSGPSLAQKADISNAKMAIQKLRTELANKQRLANIAKPAHLPELLKKDDKPSMSMKQTNSVVYGKRIRLKDDKKHQISKPNVKKVEEDFVEEVDSDSDTELSDTKSDQSTNISKNVSDDVEMSDSRLSDRVESKDSNTDTKKKRVSKTEAKSDSDIDSSSKRVFGPMRPPENYVVPENYFDQVSDRDLPEITEKDQCMDQ